MKIIQINTIFPYGSTGKITKTIFDYLNAMGVQSTVIFGQGTTDNSSALKIASTIYLKFQAVLSRVTGIMYGGCFFSTLRIIKCIKKEKPDVVHLHCLNGHFVNVFSLLRWLKKKNINTVITMHAEFMYTANCGYALNCDRWKSGCGHCPRLKQETKTWFLDGTHRSWKRMKKAFDGFNDHLIIVSVSRWLMERAKQSLILRDKHHLVVLNGVDESIFHWTDTQQLRKELRLENKTIVFHASPRFDNDKRNIKGGFVVIELAHIMKDYIFIVAGPYPEGLTVPKNVILLGNVSDQTELAHYYSMADITLLTSMKETFSMVVAESLCCGTPVVGYQAGAPERIAISKYSCFVEQGNIGLLEIKVREFTNIKWNKKELSNEATNTYSNKKMGEEYLKIYSCFDDIVVSQANKCVQ